MKHKNQGMAEALLSHTESFATICTQLPPSPRLNDTVRIVGNLPARRPPPLDILPFPSTSYLESLPLSPRRCHWHRPSGYFPPPTQRR
jgi:hypothetical protein